tara:strand:+ start:916 stop:3291 length:2376 start_codon:yes stop_codon:yes gene_type:complete
MAAFKINKFRGSSPRVASELLKPGFAQEALNLKLSSGDLVPYRAPVVVDNTQRTVNVSTIYALKNPDTNALAWLSWTTDVDIVTASDSSDNEQRFYFTGDGVPKVSNYSLSTTGSEPHPSTSGYYELGLPLPTTVSTATATSFSVVSSTHYERDSGNTATVYGGTHSLSTGDVVSIRDFASSDEAKAFNTTNVEVTVLNATDFQYYNPGAAVSKTSNTTGRIDMAGTTQIRTYIYTWITPWGEESVPSPVSNEVYIKEGQTVTVGNLPSAKPSGDNFVRGVRLYRSITSAASTDYFLLDTLWFTTSTVSFSRASNVATVILALPHNMIVGNRFKIKSTTIDSGGFNVTGGIVVSVIDKYSFTYADSGSNVSITGDTDGVLCHDVAEVVADTARYWGDSNYNFIDDFSISGLSTIIASEFYDKPKSTMKGITNYHRNMLVGFFDNQLCISFPNKPHAWPEKFRLTLNSNIVSIAVNGGYILVLTESYPYIIFGNSPASMSVTRIDANYPCLSKQSVVNVGIQGVMWATHGGMAAWKGGGGIGISTVLLHDWDTWGDYLDPTTLIGHYYNDKYFGSHESGSFTFEVAEDGGTFVLINYKFTAAYTDAISGTMYYTSDTSGDIIEWDNKTQILAPMEWKSKTITIPSYSNMGAARVVADYTVTSAETLINTNYNNSVAVSNASVWTASQQLGCLNGPTDYAVSGIRQENSGTLNAFPINGDGQTKDLVEVTGTLPITFKLFADKVLIFQGTVSSSNIFRLPSGYRSDTFEVAVSGSARVRAIHIGETPIGLKAI